VLEEWCECSISTAVAEVSGSVPAAGEDSCVAENIPATHATINRDELETIRQLQDEGEPDLLSQVISLYLDDTPALLNSLREAVSKKDVRNVRMIAHRLKSGSAYLGAAAMAGLCQQLEDLAHKNELGEAEVFLNRINKEFKVVTAVLLNESARGAA